MTEFTPITALLGGLMIGMAACLLFAGIGRIAGISGIVGQALTAKPRRAHYWRYAFVVGLLLAWPLAGHFFASDMRPAESGGGSLVVLIASGLLVGFGTRLGSGCTSGHGVCGIGRLSSRSIVATVVFMGTAAMVVFITRHLA